MRLHVQIVALLSGLLCFVQPVQAQNNALFDCTRLPAAKIAECEGRTTILTDARAQIDRLTELLSVLSNQMITATRQLVELQDAMGDQARAVIADLPENGTLDPKNADHMALVTRMEEVLNSAAGRLAAVGTDSAKATSGQIEKLISDYRQLHATWTQATATLAQMRAHYDIYIAELLEAAGADIAPQPDDAKWDTLRKAGRLALELEATRTALEFLKTVSMARSDYLTGNYNAAMPILAEACDRGITCAEMIDFHAKRDDAASLVPLVGSVRARCATDDRVVGDCTALARLLLNGGPGVAAEPTNGYLLHVTTCRAGGDESCLAAARLERSGTQIKAHPESARARYASLCLSKDGWVRKVACGHHGEMLMKGEGGPVDAARARAFLAISCNGSDDLARHSCAALGDALLQGLGGDVDKRAAYAAYTHGCQPYSNFRANGAECTAAARMDFQGDIRPANWVIARLYLERACALADGEGCALLGYALAYGEGGPKDEKAGAEAALKGCRADNGYGCFLTGFFAELGLGTDRDMGLAEQAYDKACRLDDARACSSYVVIKLNQNRISSSDGEKILQLSRTGCAAGDGKACNNLGAIHVRGLGLARPSRSLGVTYFREGCRLGNENACQNLNTMQ